MLVRVIDSLMNQAPTHLDDTVSLAHPGDTQSKSWSCCGCCSNLVQWSNTDFIKKAKLHHVSQ